MWKSKIVLLSTLALLSFSLTIQADVYDGVQVNALDISPAVYDVMPSSSFFVW